MEECVAGEEAVPFSATVFFFRLHYALDDCNLRYLTPIYAAQTFTSDAQDLERRK